MLYPMDNVGTTLNEWKRGRFKIIKPTIQNSKGTFIHLDGRLSENDVIRPLGGFTKFYISKWMGFITPKGSKYQIKRIDGHSITSLDLSKFSLNKIILIKGTVTKSCKS